MRLSVCLIARNEAQNISRALQSVAGIADELIVTDTGSTDDTCRIASQFSATLYYFPWCDDFSAAKNFTIGQASGDWILWLDADEELLPESLAELKSVIQNDDALAYYVIRQDLIDPNRLDHFTVMWQLRLFRRRADLRFQGRIHEHLDSSLQEIVRNEQLKVLGSSISLRHFGFIEELREVKRARSLQLLKLELQERPGQIYYLIELGIGLMRQGDPQAQEVIADVCELLLPYCQDKTPPVSTVAILLEHLLQLPDNLLPNGWTADFVRKLACRWFPRSTALLWISAQQHFQRGRFAQAENLLRKIVQMGKDHSYDRTVSFDPRICGEDAVLNLGVCLVRQEKVVEACNCFRLLLNSERRGKEARANFDAIQPLMKQHVTRFSQTKKRRRK